MSEKVDVPKIVVPKENIPLLPIEFLVHRKEELQLYSFKDEDYSVKKLPFPVSGGCDEVLWSHNGNYCVIRKPDLVEVVSMTEYSLSGLHNLLHRSKLLYSLPIEKVQYLYISPKDTFLFVSNKLEDQKDNLFVYFLETGELHLSYRQKLTSKSRWPPIQWTDDEAIAVKQGNDKAFILNGKDLNAPSTAFIPITPKSIIKISPYSENAIIIHYTPVSSSQPARLSFFSRENNYMREIRLYSENRSTFIECSWCSTGNYLVALLKNDVDKTGTSYYGTCTPIYVNFQKREAVTLKKDNMSVYACSWNPKGDKFIVIYDSRPMQAAIYNADNTLHFQIPTGIYNDIYWSPHSRYVALTGFGNLSGDIYVYDIYKKKMLGRCNYKSTSNLVWSYSSKYFYIYTSNYRLKVDNKFTVLKYNCKEVYTSKEDCLYDLTARPAPLDLYPIRPPSPRGKQETKTEDLNKEKKKTAYVPPHLRNANRGIPGLSSC